MRSGLWRASGDTSRDIAVCCFVVFVMSFLGLFGEERKNKLEVVFQLLIPSFFFLFSFLSFLFFSYFFFSFLFFLFFFFALSPKRNNFNKKKKTSLKNKPKFSPTPKKQTKPYKRKIYMYFFNFTDLLYLVNRFI